MNELGFLIDKEGNLYPYGKWVEYGKTQKGNRSQYHDTSFEDEISHLDKFKKLGLPYDKNVCISLQSRKFAKCGMLMVMNYTITNEKGLSFMMCSPNKINIKQKMMLKKLYPMLSNFDEQYIEILNTDNDSIIEYDSIDEYFDTFEIEHETVKVMR